MREGVGQSECSQPIGKQWGGEKTGATPLLPNNAHHAEFKQLERARPGSQWEGGGPRPPPDHAHSARGVTDSNRLKGEGARRGHPTNKAGRATPSSRPRPPRAPHPIQTVLREGGGRERARGRGEGGLTVTSGHLLLGPLAPPPPLVVLSVPALARDALRGAARPSRLRGSAALRGTERAAGAPLLRAEALREPDKATRTHHQRSLGLEGSSQ